MGRPGSWIGQEECRIESEMGEREYELIKSLNIYSNSLKIGCVCQHHIKWLKKYIQPTKMKVQVIIESSNK